MHYLTRQSSTYIMNEYLQWPTAWKAHGKCGPPESEGAEDPPVPLKCSFVPSPHFFAVSLPYQVLMPLNQIIKSAAANRTIGEKM